MRPALGMCQNGSQAPLLYLTEALYVTNPLFAVDLPRTTGR